VGIGSKMRRTSLIAILLVLLVSLFLLSVLSNILTGYPERPPDSPDTEKEQTGKDKEEEEPSVLLFKVSPVTPQLYWRVSTADYYTGLTWLRTTEEKVLEEFPQVQDANATKVFTVELNTLQRETLLPLPPPNSTFASLSSTQIEGLEFHGDTVGNVYKVIKHGQTEAWLIYKVSWRDVELDDRLISLDNIPEEILKKYLQLPDMPFELWEIAENLCDPSYSVLDQVLADVQFLRTDFVYDAEHSLSLYRHTPQGSDISLYMHRRKGICIDAATALAVILRIQQIPARISIGYKPGGIEGDKLLYYTNRAHAVTEVYLPPYGWIQFDATPLLEESPLVKVSPFKKEAVPGSTLFYQLSLTNRRNSRDNFKLIVDSKQKWYIEAAPEEIVVEAFQTADALLTVTIPDDADFGERDFVIITVVSVSHLGAASSIFAIIEVANIQHIATTTTVCNISEAVIRGDTFWVNGTVLTTSDEQVDNMTIFVFLANNREAKGLIIGKGYLRHENFQIKSTVPDFVEIGDYKLISIYLGTTQHAPSSSESIIRVCATTRMEVSSEEEFLLGYGAIYGRLLWDNGTGCAEAPVSLNITSLATPPENWQLQNLTFKDGSFRIETTFENSGAYEVKAMFSGNEYVLGSDATRVVKLKLGIPEIQVFSENVAVRGEVFNITGAIRFKHIGVRGESAAVAFDNQLLATIETRDNGSYTLSFLVDPEETLGSHILTVALEKGDVCAVHNVVVKSKTTLITKVSEAAGGMFLLFSASLSDDHGLSVAGAEVAIDNYGLSWETDKSGNLTFLLDTVKLWPENFVLTARFEGSELYLPAATENDVSIEPVTSLPFLVPLVSPTLVVMVFMYVKYSVGGWQTSQQVSDTKVVKERALVEEELVYKPEKMQLLTIVLPDIGAKFPNVWGVRDKLRIEIALDESVFQKIQKKEVEVLIDEKTVASVRLSQARAELTHVFDKKGEHKVQAILRRTSEYSPWNVEIKLRVVNYGEEIVRLYNEFLAKLASYGIHARNEMTAREIENLILRAGDFDSEAIHKVTTRFEKADYSNHLITRKDYEIMYLSLTTVNTDVE
jgi:hypothetical protein